MPTIRRYTDADCEPVCDLFIRVNRGLAPPHLKDAFESYIEQATAEEIGRIPAYYGEHRGSFWVATEEARIVGMFGLERPDSATAELRRMYVAPHTRRRGIGRQMLAFAEDAARREGCLSMVLSTSELQPDAISLYRSSGYLLVHEEYCAEQSNKTIGGGIRRFYFNKYL